jgi:hypothetical protein
MEIQSGQYKNMSDESKKSFSKNCERTIFQQKGLNDFSNYSTYARVIIRTDFTKPGDLPKLNELVLSQPEIEKLNSFYKESTLSVCKIQNSILLNWTKVTVTSLNGYKCLYYNYSRKMGENPPVFSEFYIFYNYDKQHSLNFEYRISDKLKWFSEFENCKKTFKFK